jgi:hypothetical protein
MAWNLVDHTGHFTYLTSIASPTFTVRLIRRMSLNKLLYVTFTLLAL